MTGKNNLWAFLHAHVSGQWCTGHFQAECGPPAAASLCGKATLWLSRILPQRGGRKGTGGGSTDSETPLDPDEIWKGSAHLTAVGGSGAEERASRFPSALIQKLAQERGRFPQGHWEAFKKKTCDRNRSWGSAMGCEGPPRKGRRLLLIPTSSLAICLCGPT